MTPLEDNTLYLTPINAVHMQVSAEDGIEAELAEAFSFMAENYRWHPLYRARKWDGRIRLYSPRSKKLYRGLERRVEEFAERNHYKIVNELRVSKHAPTLEEAKRYAAAIPVNIDPEKNITRLDAFQQDAVVQALTRERVLLLSPTSSGKSAIMYALMRWYLAKGLRTVVIVPSVWLVEQMYGDFVRYAEGLDPRFYAPHKIHRLYEGQSRNFSQPVLITTWQSFVKLPPAQIKTFDAIMMDEAHGAEAASLVKLMERNDTTPIRLGFTGTIKDTKVHIHTLEGIFGPTYQVSTTRELMDMGRVSDLKVIGVVLDHGDVRDKLKAAGYRSNHTLTYQEEQEWIEASPERNAFLARLAATTLDTTTLVLFQHIKHGKKIMEKLEALVEGSDIGIHYIDGEVDVKDRQWIKDSVESSRRNIILATYGTMRQGVSIPSIDTLIFASSTKSKIRSLQSIGRGLRLKDGKDGCKTYDVMDLIISGNAKKGPPTCYSLEHGKERMKFYRDEKFDLELKKVRL